MKYQIVLIEGVTVIRRHKIGRLSGDNLTEKRQKHRNGRIDQWIKERIACNTSFFRKKNKKLNIFEVTDRAQRQDAETQGYKQRIFSSLRYLTT